MGQAGEEQPAKKYGLKTFMSKEQAITNDTSRESKPLADLFLDTSVLFADIVGFTAWSSTREPSQVFVLLETVFGAFDEIAEQRRIFKVEVRHTHGILFDDVRV